MTFDLMMDYEEARSVVEDSGMNGFVKKIESIFEGDFYSCSNSWLDDSKFICKLKGEKRDVIIGWNEIHD